ncbi:hypothetical protein H4R34_002119 [Dimargaris verticillata]|uniref:Peroxisome assembly protein 22 n=1 Tax=Dimargaris verticillata TaxID=2761393 RepID=A0A9W8B4C5_9FUNG|nr:hypothetical protein H4R34_002119 [Dimargaris verticillata]
MRRSYRNTALSLVAVAATVAAISYGCYRYLHPAQAPDSNPSSQDKDVSASSSQSTLSLERLLRHLAQQSGLRNSGTTKPKLTLCLNHTLVWNPSKDPACPNYAFKPGAAALLRTLATLYDVYIIAVVQSDPEQQCLWGLLDNLDAQTPTPPPLRASSNQALDLRKVLFCQTEKGLHHIVRHLEPVVHIDASPTSLTQLLPFVPQLIWLQRPCHTPPSLALPSASDSTALAPLSPASTSSTDILSLQLTTKGDVDLPDAVGEAISRLLAASTVYAFDNTHYRSVPPQAISGQPMTSSTQL